MLNIFQKHEKEGEVRKLVCLFFVVFLNNNENHMGSFINLGE